MRFIVDACTDVAVVRHLRGLGHDVTRVGWDYPIDLGDPEILSLGVREGRILVTGDRDYGDLVVRHGLQHAGVLYFRLAGDTIDVRLARLDDVLAEFAGRLDQFLVIRRRTVKVFGQ